MATSRDYPKLINEALQEALKDQDLDEAVAHFQALRQANPESLELWAELLDELSHHHVSWQDWVEMLPSGEEGLDRAVFFLVTGILALQEESFERASYYLHRAAESAPESPVPLAYVGIMLESQGCPAEALMFYHRCLELDPELFSVLNAVGNLYHELGFYDQAVAYYRRAFPLLEEPVNQSILLGNLGNSLRAIGQLDEAVAVYTEAIAIDPSQPTNPVFLAETLLEAKRTPHVIACLTDLMMMPSFDEWPLEVQHNCFRLLARAYAEERQFPASLLFMWVRNGGRLNEEDREGTSSLLKVLFCWAITNPGTPVNDCLLARLNRCLGYLDAALHHAKRAAKADPQRPDHFIELGATLILQGKMPVALEALEEAHSLAPERADIQCFKAQALWQTYPEDAMDALLTASRLEPNQALHHCDLAYLHQANGDTYLAQESFQKAVLLWSRAPVLHGPHGPVAQRGCYTDVIEPFLAENATSPEAANRLLTAANYLILCGRRDAARKALHRLLSEQPNNLNALRNYAWLLTREGWHEEALSIWRKVLADVPDDDVSRYFAMQCLSRQGSEGKRAAIAELDKALSARPDYYLGRLLLGKLLDPDGEALDHFETLCRQLPTFYSVWYHQGQSLFHRREHQAAVPLLQKAIALNGQFAPARQLLSQAHRHLGNLPESHVEQGHYYFLTRKYHLARFSYEEALEFDGDLEEAHQGVQRVERRLQRYECPVPEDLYAIVAPRYRLS